MFNSFEELKDKVRKCKIATIGIKGYADLCGIKDVKLAASKAIDSEEKESDTYVLLVFYDGRYFGEVLPLKVIDCVNRSSEQSLKETKGNLEEKIKVMNNTMDMINDLI